MNGLSDNLRCKYKFVADETLLFSTARPGRAATNLNNDLEEINGHSRKKLASTLTQQSKLKRLFLVERPQRQFVL